MPAGCRPPDAWGRTTAGQRRVDLAKTSIELIEGQILQRDQFGKVAGRIDLDDRFYFEYRHCEDNEAIYRLTQHLDEVEFDSSNPLAEEIATKILGLQWPPRGIRMRV